MNKIKEIRLLKEKVGELELNVFKLQHPFQYNLGDRVVLNNESWKSDVIDTYKDVAMTVCDRKTIMDDDDLYGNIRNVYLLLYDGERVSSIYVREDQIKSCI